MADPSERSEPPKRRDLLRALRAAEILLRRIGSDWEELPGHARLPALALARRLERLLERAE